MKTKIYRANEELASILIANGYRDTTAEIFPNHVNKKEGKREYTLFNMKRTPNSPYIQFDYMTITEYSLQFFEDSIDQEYLRVLICFHKLSFQLRHSIITSLIPGATLSSIVWFLHELQKSHAVVEGHPTKRDAILKAFNEVKI